VVEAFERGWDRFLNGELIAAAASLKSANSDLECPPRALGE